MKKKQTKYNELNDKGIKQFLKILLPNNLVRILKKQKQNYNSIILYNHDVIKKRKYLNNDSITKLEYDLLINIHIIEKGLAHENIRYNFGANPLKNISFLLNSDKISNEVYNYTVSALSEYYFLHKNNNKSLEFFESLFSYKVLNDITNNDKKIGGVKYLKKDHKSNNRQKNFKDLSLNRYSIREFNHSPIDVAKIEEAIEIASKTPSACNRQSTKVIFIDNAELIQQVLEIQEGYRGYEIPNLLGISLVDLNAYSSYTDRNMCYVDGGLYTMSIVYAFEFVGLGCCLLNASFTRTKEKKIRKLLQIEENYEFISLMVMGNFKDSIKVPSSYRLKKMLEIEWVH